MTWLYAFVIGGCISLLYVWSIQKGLSALATARTESPTTSPVPSRPPKQSPNTHLSIQLLPSVNEDRDITTDVTGAMIVVWNDGTDTQLDFDRLVKFPPIKDAVPDGAGRIQIISGNKRGSTFIHIAAPSLVAGERHSISVTFLKSWPYLSAQRWAFDYGYSEDIFVQRAFIGPEQNVATPSNTPPQSVIEQPTFGNLAERARALSDEIMKDLYLHGWREYQRQGPPPLFEHIPKDATKMGEWMTARSNVFRFKFLARVRDMQEEFATFHLRNEGLDEELKMERETPTTALIYPQTIERIADSLKELASQTKN